MRDKYSLALAVLFFLGLQGLTLTFKNYWLIFAIFLVIMAGITIWFQRNNVKNSGPGVLTLPLSYTGSVYLFNLFPPQGIIQQLFIVLSAMGFYYLLSKGVNWAFPTWNWFFTSITFFLFAGGVYGLYFFIRFPLWVVIIMDALMVFLLSFHVIRKAPLTMSKTIFWSALLALIVSEFLGVFAFLPISYLVVSGCLFIIFYVALHLLQRYLYDEITFRIAVEYLALGTFGVSLMLGTTSWTVI